MEVNDVKDLEKQLRAFAEERDWDQFHSVKNLILALVGEVGELSEIFQWMTDDATQHLSTNDKLRAEEELADVFLYLIRLSDKLDIDLIEVAKKKIELNALKYPIEVSKGNATKYNMR